MESALRGVIEKMRNGEQLPEDAIIEIENLLDMLRAEGWTGWITADEALSAIILRKSMRLVSR